MLFKLWNTEQIVLLYWGNTEGWCCCIGGTLRDGVVLMVEQ